MVRVGLERNAHCLLQPISHHSVKCLHYGLASLHWCNTKLFYSVLASTINWRHVQGEPRFRSHAAGTGSSTPECMISGGRQWMDGWIRLYFTTIRYETTYLVVSVGKIVLDSCDAHMDAFNCSETKCIYTSCTNRTTFQRQISCF